MRAVVVQQGKLELTELPVPEPGPGQLLVRVAATGICGSDLKTAGYMPDGTVLGHEFSGEVVAAGAGVEAEWPVGTHVASLPVMGCGRCRDCLARDPARCTEGTLLGVGTGAGAFAEFVVVGARETVRLDSSIPLATGAIVEPLAVGLHLAEAGRIAAGQRVLIIGAGPVGLAVALWARHRNAAEIVMIDPAPSRREAAALFGATRAVEPGDAGDGFDAVIECVGLPGLVTACIDAVRPRGHAVIGGVSLEEEPIWPVAGVMKDITLAFGSYYTTEEFALTAELLGNGQLDPGPFVTSHIALHDLPATFESLKSVTDQRKVLVSPSQA